MNAPRPQGPVNAEMNLGANEPALSREWVATEVFCLGLNYQRSDLFQDPALSAHH